MAYLKQIHIAFLPAQAGRILRSLLIGSVFALSACVSSLVPVAPLDNTSEPTPTPEQVALAAQQEKIGEQQLVQTLEGHTISLPTPYPSPVSGELAMEASNNVEGQSQSDELIPRENQEPENASVQLADGDPTIQQETTELALVVPRPNPVAPGIDTNAAPPDTAGQTASKLAVNQQATKELKRPSFLARLFKRPPKNVGSKDDRNNPILTSSRTASASNRGPAPARATLTAMPGVRSNADIFGIQKNLGDANDRVQLASAASLARLSPTALRTQHSRVNVSCIRPEVLQLLNIVEQKYGKKPIVTSGYRSPSRNRKAGGARNSMHIYCKAVDIQVEGVSKWNLAKFMRTIPGRGGVGTYCRTKSVHIDIGPKRDWHYSCRRKSKRRRKA